jgi:hypothetical protein
LTFGIHDNAKDFQSKEAIAANEVLSDILGNLPLFTLCKDSSIRERLMWIGTPIGTKAEFLMPAVHCFQGDLRQQRFFNIGISEALENWFLNLQMEVVLQVALAAIGDQG